MALPYMTARSLGYIDASMTEAQYNSLSQEARDMIQNSRSGDVPNGVRAPSSTSTGIGNSPYDYRYALAYNTQHAQGKREQLMTAAQADILYRAAVNRINQATWRGGLTDEDYQWLYDNRGPITQAALGLHGGTQSAGYRKDRTIQTLLNIGRGIQGKNVVREGAKEQSEVSNSAEAADRKRRQAAEFWNRQRDIREGNAGGGSGVAVSSVNNDTQVTTQSSQTSTGNSNKSGGTGPYNPGERPGSGRHQDANTAGAQQLNRVQVFSNMFDRDKGRDRAGGPGDPNPSYPNSGAYPQITSQRSGYSGNRRIYPFAGNNYNNQVRGG